MTPSHIAILVSALGAGGAERVIAQLAEHWVDSGHRVTIMTFDCAGDEIFHPLPASVELARLCRKAAGLFGNFARIAALRGALRRHKPDVLVSFLTRNNALAAVSSFGLPVQLACCERNNPERQATHPLWRWLLALAYRRADVIVCQTDAVRRCFPAAVQDRLAVIANPIAPSSAAKIPQSAHRRVSAVGRLTYQKGFDVLIKAFADVAGEFSEWHLDIWGEGPDREDLDSLIGRLGMRERIALRGTSAAPGSWIDHTDLFVLSSRYEGFPNVLGEAMSAGLPVIATRCDFGPSEMVDDEQTGLLIEPEDTASMRQALRRLLAEPALRERLGRNGRTSIARLSPERIFGLWDRLIDQYARSPGFDESGMADDARHHAAE